MLKTPTLASLVLALATLGVKGQSTSSTTLKLAKSYSGSGFTDGFDFFTDDDPTGGYVNYVSQDDAASKGLTSIDSTGAFIMAADSTNNASGRGRNSVRISSKDKFADGVYILDLNHLPVGCGTWPAFWTVTQTKWPKGGEIDIIEGANALPSLGSAAYNATAVVSPVTSNSTYNTASLHTATNCLLDQGTYMSGTLETRTCDAYLNSNQGCGIEMSSEVSFGSGVNEAQGGYYAMWRDIEKSGGVYIYYWPRNSDSIPAEVKSSSATTTNVANWGVPSANLTVPNCGSDFNNHVIVFDLTFCGDYSATTYAASGCPSTCSNFVQNTPSAFTQAYWSINSLRVFTASGKPAKDAVLSGGDIAGIVVGVVVGLALIALIWWRVTTTRRARKAMMDQSGMEEEDMGPQAYNVLAAGKGGRRGSSFPAISDESRRGSTFVGDSSRRGSTFLAGETPTKLERRVYDDEEPSKLSVYNYTPEGSQIQIASPTRRGSAAGPGSRRGSAVPLEPRRGSLLPGQSTTKLGVYAYSPEGSQIKLASSTRRGSAVNQTPTGSNVRLTTGSPKIIQFGQSWAG
ncbi:hypothetical protein P7C73_g2919, partial [Tremellales sp. Uapishka_1]